jgi:uncharacterized protein (TIGR00297 family)
LQNWLTGSLLGVGVASLAYWRRALTLDGAVAAAVVGGITFARGGSPPTGALLAFFGSSSLLSRLGEARKQALPLAQAKGTRRDAWQVLANGGVATLCAFFGLRNAAVGALAAAGADTWATELGLLARSRPRLITSLRRVPPGTSGGVTLEGFLASLGGALVVGVTAAALGGGGQSARAAALAGLGGSLIDSLLGATLQAEYVCSRCAEPTEEGIHPHCGTPATLQRGYAWMTNDTVNALATLSGAALASF